MSESIHELFPGDLVSILVGAHVSVCKRLMIRSDGTPINIDPIAYASGPCVIVSAMPARELHDGFVTQKCFAIDPAMIGWIHVNVKSDNRATRMIERPEP